MSRTDTVANLSSCLPLLVALWLAVAAGCAGHRCAMVGGPACVGSPPALASYDSASERTVELDSSRVGTADAVLQNSQQHGSFSAHCYALSAAACQELSRAHSSQGNLLDQKVRAIEQGKHVSATDCLLASACRDMALHARNRSAADGLELYFRLLEAESIRHWTELAIEEVDRALDNYERFREQGMQLPVDDSRLQRQRHELRSQLEQLWLAREQSQGGLRLQIGLCANDEQPIWPASRVVVTTEPVDVPVEVSIGLAQRRDLSALRRICRCQNEPFDQGTTGLLSALHPAMAIILAPSSGRGGSATTQPSMVCCSLLEREQVAEEEIRQAARSVESSLIRVALAREERDRTRTRLSELESRRAADHVTIFDLSAARIEALHGEGELSKQVIAWQLAMVSLWKATEQFVCTPDPIVAQTAPSAPPLQSSHSRPMPAESLPPPARTPAGRS